jgi:hypothetical protein
VNPVVDNQPVATAIIPGTHTTAQEFSVQHKDAVDFALAHAALLKLVSEHQAVVTAAALNPTLANQAAVAAAIGLKNALQLNSLKAEFERLVVPNEAALTYLSAHQSQLTALQNGVAKSPKQWQNWFWVCVGGMVLFIPTIWLTKGRWHPSRAKRDEDEHEAEVAAELKELVGADA